MSELKDLIFKVFKFTFPYIVLSADQNGSVKLI